MSLGQWLKLNANTVSYRLMIMDDERTGGTVGAVVSGINNQVTGSMVDLNVHPYMPLGCSLIRSNSLPVPDSEVNNTAEVINVQDYMSVEWPVIQMTYDQSTYLFGTLVHYAPGVVWRPAGPAAVTKTPVAVVIVLRMATAAGLPASCRTAGRPRSDGADRECP
jgi:hypothetical protein